MRLWRTQAARAPAFGVSIAFLVLVLAAVAGYVNVAHSSAGGAVIVAIAAASALAIGAGVVRYRPLRLDFWCFLTAAVAAGAVAAVIWHSRYAAADAPPVSGGLQDVFFIAFYVLLGAALITALKRSELGNQGLLDAAIFAAGLMLLALLILIEPFITTNELSTLGRTVQIASAFADVCLLGLALRLLMTTEAETPALQLLAGATLAWIASDVVRIWLTLASGYVPGSSVAIGWLVFFGLCGAAALQPSMVALSTTDELRPIVRWPFVAVLGMALLGSTVATGYGLIVKQEVNSAATVGLAALLSLLVVARLSLLLREEQRLRHELDLRNERLLELDRMKDGFVAAVSHELRTPLTSIRGFATTMTERWSQLNDDEKLAFLQTIDSQARRLNRLVDSVLLLSRIQAGRVSSAPESLDIAATAREAAKELGLEIGIEVNGEREAVAEADPDQIHQVLVNLLANARRYGMPPFRVRIDSGDSDVTVRVSDEGEGVPASFVPSLFEHFTQAPHVRPAQGSGLGLAIVKGLVETAGGEVWYEGLQPHGSCFAFRLHRPASPGSKPPLVTA